MELRIEALSKTYPGGVRALHDVSLAIGPGMFGLLGPNGAGKSTLMRTIATLQRPDTGTVRLDDIDVVREPARLRRVLGYLPQEFGLYPNLTAEVILDHFATLKGITDRSARREVLDAILHQTNLQDARREKAGAFSGGMKQRLGIAIALLGRPKLLIVDEPTAGLDPTERQRFLGLLADVGRDVIVILSTHIVEDVRELCRSMAIIDRGNLLLQGDPARLLDQVRGRIWRKPVTRETLPVYRDRFPVISVRLVGGEPVVNVYAEAQPADGFEVVEPVLEDVYFHRVGAGAALET
jgi:ABC-2 type transport system ATP-binding protein